KVDGENYDLNVLAIKNKGYFNIVILNTTQKNINYSLTLNLKNVSGVKEFKIYKLDDSNTGEKAQGVIPFNTQLQVSSMPYSITVLQGKLDEIVKWGPITAYTPEPSSGAMGLVSAGQY